MAVSLVNSPKPIDKEFIYRKSLFDLRWYNLVVIKLTSDKGTRVFSSKAKRDERTKTVKLEYKIEERIEGIIF